MSRSFQLLGIYWPGIVLIGNLTTAAVLLYGGFRVIGHEMQVGVLAAFVLYLRRFFEPLAEVSQFYDSFQAAAAGLEKLAGVLDEEPGVPFPERGVVPPEGGLAARSSSATSALPTEAGATSSRVSTCTYPPARPWPCSEPPAPARAPSPGCWLASTIRSRAR